MAVKKPAPRKKTRFSNSAFAMILLAFVVLAALELKPKEAAKEADPALATHFAGYEASFVLMQPDSGAYLRHNPARAAQRLTPMSTFKIPAALIALDTGVADGPGFTLKWDGRQWPYPYWERDHTLATAIQGSVVWYFQELARRVGSERMHIYLKFMEYGNADISGGIDRFWLGSSLAISAEEQVRFLDLLVRNKLPVGSKAMEQVRGMLELGRSDKAALFGKTGTDIKGGKATLGWFVGWLTRADKVYIFATNLAAAEGTSEASVASGAKARQITEDILREKRLW